MTRRPGQAIPDGWANIPGAAGCTPQSRSFRDSHDEIKSLGASLFGMSTKTVENQIEARQRQGVELAKAAGRYTGRKTDRAMHDRIVALRAGGNSISETTKLAGCSQSQVQRVSALMRAKNGATESSNAIVQD